METEIEDNGQPKTRLIEYAGKAQTVEAWAREIGLSAPVIRYRIRNGGMGPKQAAQMTDDKPQTNKPDRRLRGCVKASKTIARTGALPTLAMQHKQDFFRHATDHHR